MILRFIFIELVLFLRRVIFKDNNYIKSVKQGRHNRYIKKDIILAFAISFVLISISIFLDSHLCLENYGDIIAGIGGVIISNIGIAIYVTSIANYMYAIKPKNQAKIYKVKEYKK